MRRVEEGVQARTLRALEGVVVWIEVVVSAVLAILLLYAVVVLVLQTLALVLPTPPGPRSVTSVIASVLDVFVVVELFRIGAAYVRHRDVVSTVLETALVVAAREIVVIKAGTENPLLALGVAGVLVAIGLTWFLLRRAGTCADLVPDEGRE